MTYTKCILCKCSFSHANVFSTAGWKEMQISGMCEACFDAMFEDMEEDDE